MLILPPTIAQSAMAFPPYSEERRIRLADRPKLTADDSSGSLPTESTSTLLKRYFGDKWQDFATIAACESTSRQFHDDGRTVTSTQNRDGTHDHGFLQINDKNITEAYTIGLDVLGSLEDNIHMASILFDRQGYGAWATCSRKAGFI